MGNTIWAVLAGYEGNWVAVDGGGEVVAHAGSLDEVMKATRDDAGKLTYLYAAPELEAA
ncbi:MAG: hypothetical protein HY079_05270 [Elusimicrobia bacterium]|nr:hypothetical protein [Elusimicrobiota bacterium]